MQIHIRFQKVIWYWLIFARTFGKWTPYRDSHLVQLPCSSILRGRKWRTNKNSTQDDKTKLVTARWLVIESRLEIGSRPSCSFRLFPEGTRPRVRVPKRVEHLLKAVLGVVSWEILQQDMIRREAKRRVIIAGETRFSRAISASAYVKLCISGTRSTSRQVVT